MHTHANTHTQNSSSNIGGGKGDVFFLSKTCTHLGDKKTQFHNSVCCRTSTYLYNNMEAKQNGGGVGEESLYNYPVKAVQVKADGREHREETPTHTKGFGTYRNGEKRNN